MSIISTAFNNCCIIYQVHVEGGDVKSVIDNSRDDILDAFSSQNRVQLLLQVRIENIYDASNSKIFDFRTKSYILLGFEILEEVLDAMIIELENKIQKLGVGWIISEIISLKIYKCKYALQIFSKTISNK